MRKLFHSLIVQFKGFYKTLTPVKRASIVGSGLAILVTIFVMINMISTSEYQDFVKNVPAERLPLIVETLRKKNVPFSLRDDGSTIAIPRNLVPAMQMSLMAELGSTDIGTLGFEIFDKENLGTTSYTQRVNFQRGLQGELIRSINTLNAVKKSKVILALPTKKTFLEEEEKASASVILELHPGKTLSDEQIRGVIFLVANSVQGLDPDRVTVINSDGRVMSKNMSGSMGETSEFLEIQTKFEKEMENRVESILTKVVGNGNVIVRVNAKLNPRNIKTVEEIIDPDKTALRSTQAESENLDGSRTSPNGIPGARANLPGAETGGQVGLSQTVKKELTTSNYEIPKTTREFSELAGAVERLSVAVLVDGKWEVQTNADGKQEKAWVKRTPEELTQYENIVRNTIGFSQERNDSIKIENIQFRGEDFEEADKFLEQVYRKELFNYIIKWAMLGFLFALIFFVIVRPFMRWVTDSFQESVEDMLPKTIEELEELQTIDNSLPGMSSAMPKLSESIDPKKAESELLKERIVTLIEQDQEKAASAFGLWLVRKDNQ